MPVEDQHEGILHQEKKNASNANSDAQLQGEKSKCEMQELTDERREKYRNGRLNLLPPEKEQYLT